MKLYQIWDAGQVVGMMELDPDEVEMLTAHGLEVYEVGTQKEVAA